MLSGVVPPDDQPASPRTAMAYPTHTRGPLTPSERWIYIIALALFLGLLTAEVLINYQPVKLTILFFLLSWAPLLVLHEAGHAVVAALLGWRVERVVIGMGRVVGRFR